MSDQKAPQEVKFLDLDALAPEVAVSITLNGEKHEMAEMTVKDFVWAQKIAAENQNVTPDDMKEEDYEKVMERMIYVLSRQFPTCKRDEIAGLSISILTALICFTGQLCAEGRDAVIYEGAAQC